MNLGKNLFKAAKALGKRLLGLDLKPAPFQSHLLGVSEVSLGERNLPADAFSVKRKLGASFFTRRLNPRTRSKYVRGLTKEERSIAQARGWI